ncbi:MAG: DUF3105 domain-containing protein [Chloroflexota bacterium]
MHRTILVIAGTVVIALGIAGSAALGPARAQESTFDLPGAATPAPPRPEIEGVAFVDVWSNRHTEGPVQYDQDPPAGGPHNPTWQSCGFYDVPVPTERAVHSQEHGAVWITYRADIADADLKAIRQLAKRNPYVLASPYEGLAHPLVASAWGAQLALDSAADPRLQAFVEFYANSPDGPEFGAPCADSGTDSVDPIAFPAGATPLAQPAATPGATPAP